MIEPCTFLLFFSFNYCRGEKIVLPLRQKKQRLAFLQGIGRLRAAFFIYHGIEKKSNFLYRRIQLLFRPQTDEKS